MDTHHVRVASKVRIDLDTLDTIFTSFLVVNF